MKKCPKCTRVREDQKFYKKTYPNGTVGLRSYCIECSTKERDEWRLKNKEYDDARNNEYNQKNARRIRGFKLQTYWPDLDPEQTNQQYEKMLTEQNGVCYLCKEVDKRLHKVTGTRWQLAVDHCADTGIVRGLLCNQCNRALGLFKHDVDLLQKAMLYLKEKGGK